MNTLRGITLFITLALVSAPCGLSFTSPDASADATTFQNQMKSGIKWLEKAQSAYIRGEDDLRVTYAGQAEAVFLELARQHPRDLRPCLFAGQAAALRGDPNGAWAWSIRYKERSPHGEGDPDLHFLRAFVFMFGADKPDQAIRALNRMYAINAKVRPVKRDTLMYVARMRLGEVLMGRREYEHSIKQFKEAARLGRRHRWRSKELAALGNAGMTMRLASMWKSAEDVFAGMLKIDPDNVLWHWHMGLTLAGQLKFEPAIAEYKQVIEMREKGLVLPQHAADVDMVFLRIGNSYRNLAGATADETLRNSLFERAEENLRKYVELRPKDAMGPKWLGHLHYPDREAPYAAIPFFEQAFALDPDCDSSLRSLTQIYSRYPAPPVEGESDADAAERQAAWQKQGAAYKKDLEDNAEKRKLALEERERKSLEDDDGCE